MSKINEIRKIDGKNKPNHLGGHGNKCHVDIGILDYFINNYKIKSFIDVGCGTGAMVDTANAKGLESIGIDGDYTVDRSCECIIHDYEKGELKMNLTYDLCWCVEFLEHVHEEFIPNYMATFKSARYIVITHALPSLGGHHHVNCQEFDYWLKKFTEYGFNYNDELTKKIKEISTMKREFIRNTGAVFTSFR